MLSLLLSLALVARPAARPDLRASLPPKATINVQTKLDLTGDGRPELIIGYTLPTGRIPPTEGHAIVLEQGPRGTYRRFDLPGVWPGHYPPHFRAVDLTGDGRPELVEDVAGGGAWEMMRVFLRTATTYEMLLEDPAVSHLLWDVEQKGRPEIIARKRWGNINDQYLQRFIWRDGRFVAWHAPEWRYAWGERKPEGPQPPVVGLTLKEAEERLTKVGLQLGVIAEVDQPGEPGRTIRAERRGDEVEVVLPAGSTRFAAPKVPQLASVYLSGAEGHWGDAPVAGTPEDLARWQRWLQGLIGGTVQVVHTRYPVAPVYQMKLEAPWPVKLGDQSLAVRWIGVPLEVPLRGLVYLATEDPQPGRPWPRFKSALYTRAPLEPLPIPAPKPLKEYLTQHRTLESFVTLWPGEWETAVRQRGISPSAWPELEYAPALEGPVTPDASTSPEPDHVVVTVLNGFVRRAVRSGDEVRVDLVGAPGRAYRWVLPLTGFNRATQVVRLKIYRDGALVNGREIPLNGWRDWQGNPGPGSLTDP